MDSIFGCLSLIKVYCSIATRLWKILQTKISLNGQYPTFLASEGERVVATASKRLEPHVPTRDGLPAAYYLYFLQTYKI